MIADLEVARKAGELGELPERDFTFRDWIVTCVAYPNAPGKRDKGGGLLGTLPSRAFFLENIQRIREAVRKKGAYYGAPDVLDKPLVIAVLSVNTFAERADVTEATFGSTALRVPVAGDPKSAATIRSRDGYWRGPNSDRGVRVSAVLFSHDIQPWSVASHLPAVWINPWAENPIDAHPPFTTYTATDQGLVSETPSNTTPSRRHRPADHLISNWHSSEVVEPGLQLGDHRINAGRVTYPGESDSGRARAGICVAARSAAASRPPPRSCTLRTEPGRAPPREPGPSREVRHFTRAGCPGQVRRH